MCSHSLSSIPGSSAGFLLLLPLVPASLLDVLRLSPTSPPSGPSLTAGCVNSSTVPHRLPLRELSQPPICDLI